jgi:hypothetical protein
MALLGAMAFWGLWALVVPIRPKTWIDLCSTTFVSTVFFQPFIEELFFRGWFQGEVGRLAWTHRAWKGLTLANGITSLLFAATHLWSHPAGWAVAVMIPALVFGYFRDRYTSTYPAIALHIYYNVGYALLFR